VEEDDVEAERDNWTCSRLKPLDAATVSPADWCPYRKPPNHKSENKPETKTKRQQTSERKAWKDNKETTHKKKVRAR
jgi:hypothetical protein